MVSIENKKFLEIRLEFQRGNDFLVGFRFAIVGMDVSEVFLVDFVERYRF